MPRNIVFPYVHMHNLSDLWKALDAAGLAPANLDLISDIIACPGLDYCSLANARSIPVAQKITERFASPERQRDLGELKLKISGCINACGHHHAGHIGILGVDKRGTENYQLSLGGSGARGCQPRQDHRPRLRRGRHRRRGRDGNQRLSGTPRGWRTLPRHLSPRRHGTVQRGALWVTCSTMNPPSRSTRFSMRRPTPPPSASKRGMTRVRCCPISTVSHWSK